MGSHLKITPLSQLESAVKEKKQKNRKTEIKETQIHSERESKFERFLERRMEGGKRVESNKDSLRNRRKKNFKKYIINEMEMSDSKKI